MKRHFTVIGLGLFGSTVASELARLGHDVTGIDISPERVSTLADHITHAVIADARDEKALRELGVQDADVVLISIGEDIEANLLAALHVKAMGKPKLWVEALNHSHHQILLKLGADQVVHPEHEMGLRLAHTMMYPEVMDYINIGDDQYIVELHTSARLAGKTLLDLALAENSLQCIMVKRAIRVIFPVPAEYAFEIDDQIILLGTLSNLRKISKYL